jgi:hypothetical protein
MMCFTIFIVGCIGYPALMLPVAPIREAGLPRREKSVLLSTAPQVQDSMERHVGVKMTGFPQYTQRWFGVPQNHASGNQSNWPLALSAADRS